MLRRKIASPKVNGRRNRAKWRVQRRFRRKTGLPPLKVLPTDLRQLCRLINPILRSMLHRTMLLQLEVEPGQGRDCPQQRMGLLKMPVPQR